VRREQVFWGWGEPGAGPRLPEDAGELLRERLGVSGEVVDRPVALGDVRLGEPELDDGLLGALRAAVGEEAVRQDREARVLRCRGKSYLDLLAQRAGDCLGAPDAVVAPGGHEEVLEVLRLCAEAGVAVVPFGGGTSVVGGLEPDRAGLAGLVSLDLGRMDGVGRVDRRSLTAVLGPGLRLPEADRALAAEGLTLGHVPQSYEWATVGGCVATRSAGQSSTGRGAIADNVVALRCATPLGELATGDAPASAAGPDLRELLAGSEGALGVLTEVALRVHPRAAAARHEGWFSVSFAEGVEALRALAQADGLVDLARLSDEDETRTSLALAGGGGLAGRAYLRARLGAAAPGCLVVLGWEGDEEAIRRRRRDAAAVLRHAGLVPAGRGPGAAWAAARFAGPHLRDDLLDRGVLVETLETAASWERLGALRDSVGAALRGALAATPPLVGCHVSHLYPTGAALYFTVLAAREDDGAVQWRRAKAAALEAVLAGGGTISHHHGVGRDHAPWLEREAGPLGLGVLRAAKVRLDPAGVMNPGKLLEAQPRSGATPRRGAARPTA
jgi:alkyldihydroxyacetonephosphate synthase